MAEFNVRASPYDAVGDGVADDRSAINSAIAALNAAGRGTLLFPAGTYKISGGLTPVTAVCTVRGEGMCSALNASVSNVDVLTIAQANFTVRDLALNANAGTQTGGAAIKLAQTAQGGLNLIEHVALRNAYDGIRIGDYVSSLTIEKCVIGECYRYGIYRSYDGLLPDSGDDYIFGNLISSSHPIANAAAIRFNAHGGAKVLGNKVIGAWTTGIDIRPADGTSSGVTAITGNSIEGPTSCIFLSRAGTTGTWIGVTIGDNQLNSAGGENVHVGSGISVVTIGGNACVASSGGVGVDVTGTAAGVMIDGNSFYGQGIGIAIGASVTTSNVGANAFTGVTTPISDQRPH